MELKPSPDTDDFRYFDPKLLKPSDGGSASAPKSRAPYQDAIVFMVGGGTYAEYQNLVDYAKVRNLILSSLVVISDHYIFFVFTFSRKLSVATRKRLYMDVRRLIMAISFSNR